MNEGRLARLAAALEGASGQSAVDRLLDACLELLPISGAGIAFVGDGEHLGTLAVAGPSAAAANELQFTVGEGPCIAADRTPHPVIVPDLAVALGRWPAFGPAAQAVGVAGVFAFPLRVGPVHLGVLTLYRSVTGDLDAQDLADAVALARVAAHLLLEFGAELAPGFLPHHLAEVVGDRAVVHQATGMVAAQLHADVATALAHLRASAWTRDLSLHDVATDVVARRLRFDPPPVHPDPDRS